MKKTALIVLTAILALFLWGCQLTCGTCDGEEAIACSTCQGSGSVDCPEPECENGSTGASCTNCFGREGMRTCSACEGEGAVYGPCSKCEGSGKIVNPITWEAFECAACDGAGLANEDCDKCGGYGLTCNYCESNRSSYPTADWHPYYRECATCQGEGSFACDDCTGAGSFPCPDCREEEYNATMSSIEQKKAEEASEAERQALIDEALEVGYPSLAQLEQAESLLNSYDGSFAEKTELLNGIAAVKPYCDTRWTLSEGDPDFFGNWSSSSGEYIIKVSYGGVDFDIRICPADTVEQGVFTQGKLFHVCFCGDCAFNYKWGGTNESYKVFAQEDGSLLINQYEKDTYGDATDTVVNSCTLKRKN